MRVYVVEPHSGGSIGPHIVVRALRSAGHDARLVQIDRDASGQQSLYGGRVSSAADLPRPDAWAVSTYYVRQWVHIGPMFRWMGLAPLRRDRLPTDPAVWWGGHVTSAPAPLEDFADVIAIGDGEVTAPKLARLSTAVGHDRRAIRQACVGEAGLYVPGMSDGCAAAWSPMIEPWLIRHGGGPSIEAARGCRGRCRFCSLAWRGGPYRESEWMDVRELLRTRSISGASVNVFAPDIGRVSWSGKLTDEAARLGLRLTGTDISAQAVLAGASTPKRPSIGIEGVSERLRRAVGKPISYDEIMRVCEAYRDVGLKAYMIPGLPGETDADRDEGTRMIAEMESILGKRLHVSISPFKAIPHTPLDLEPVSYPGDAVDWVRRLRAERSGATGASLVYEAVGEGLYTYDQWALRAGQEAALSLLDIRPSHISSERWMDRVDPSAEMVSPTDRWTHIRTGIPRHAVEAGRLAYWRALEAP